MIRRYLHQSLPAAAAVLLLAVLSSCTVDENAALTTSGSPTGDGKKEKKTEVKTGPETLSWSEKMKADQERKKAEQAAEKAKIAAAKSNEEAAEAKKLAAAKKIEDAAALKAAREDEKRLAAGKKAEAAAEAAELAAAEAKVKAKADKAAADKKAREDALAAKVQEREAAKLAKLEEKKKAEADRAARDASQDVAAVATSNRRGGGFFSLLSIGTTSKQYQSEGHDIFVNEMLLPTLNPSNAKIEVSLGEQRARVYRKDGGEKVLVIDTQISSGKPGHATSTGTYHIKEKLVAKQSTLYGTWVNSSGQTVGGSDSRSRPSGGSRFVGADMPYWMRINGGIGMHIGYVPGYPASHGCIRVPEAVQPLIFSKVGLGTQVTIMH
jgi:lipoprotein-anchoring transpeptidase ErfK/SrfK